jgi:hypothetical protein
MFLGLSDPDRLRGTDPDPSIINNIKKTLNPTVL